MEQWREQLYTDELYHYGVKGMKWHKHLFGLDPADLAARARAGLTSQSKVLTRVSNTRQRVTSSGRKGSGTIGRKVSVTSRSPILRARSEVETHRSRSTPEQRVARSGAGNLSRRAGSMKKPKSGNNRNFQSSRSNNNTVDLREVSNITDKTTTKIGAMEARKLSRRRATEKGTSVYKKGNSVKAFIQNKIGQVKGYFSAKKLGKKEAKKIAKGQAKVLKRLTKLGVSQGRKNTKALSKPVRSIARSQAKSLKSLTRQSTRQGRKTAKGLGKKAKSIGRAVNK